ncbi:ADP-ribosylation factor family-domain-containing protein [Limtongia smithiae]|uniref:ADP-ribosylation factor family-domain-containing protein n=1 Tax=Limtongia smithiae TaxID=1125753 RepID=UPI0034CFF016
MGLLTTIRKQKIKDKEIRVLILGLDNSGKTTLVRHLLHEDVSTVSPTLGFAIRTLSDIGGYTLQLWDVGGQSSLRPFWRNYFDRTDVVIWVVDATTVGEERLSECRAELSKVVAEDKLSGAGVLVLVNKIDSVPSSVSIDDIVKTVRVALALDRITNHEWIILPCSAYTGENIDQGLRWAIDEVKRRLYRFD